VEVLDELDDVVDDPPPSSAPGSVVEVVDDDLSEAGGSPSGVAVVDVVSKLGVVEGEVVSGASGSTIRTGWGSGDEGSGGSGRTAR
jgi:hypothetical protein